MDSDMKIACLASESTATKNPQLDHSDMWQWYMTHRSHAKVCTINFRNIFNYSITNIESCERQLYTSGLTDIFAFIYLWLPPIRLYVCLTHTHKIVWKCAVLIEFTFSQQALVTALQWLDITQSRVLWKHHGQLCVCYTVTGLERHLVHLIGSFP